MGNAFKQAIAKSKSATQPAAKKSSMPIIEITDSNVSSAIADFIDAQGREKSAKADKEFAGATVIEHVRAIQDKKALKGDFHKSYQVKSDSGNVKFVTADKFSVNDEDEDNLKNLLGESYDSLLEEKVSVTLKAEIFEDEKKQTELMNLLGDKFAEFFDVNTKLQAVKGFDEKIYQAVDSQAKLDEVRTYAKQNKPSVR